MTKNCTTPNITAALSPLVTVNNTILSPSIILRMALLWPVTCIVVGALPDPSGSNSIEPKANTFCSGSYIDALLVISNGPKTSPSRRYTIAHNISGDVACVMVRNDQSQRKPVTVPALTISTKVPEVVVLVMTRLMVVSVLSIGRLAVRPLPKVLRRLLILAALR